MSLLHLRAYGKIAFTKINTIYRVLYRKLTPEDSRESQTLFTNHGASDCNPSVANNIIERLKLRNIYWLDRPTAFQRGACAAA